MEKTEREEKRKLAIRRAVVRWIKRKTANCDAVKDPGSIEEMTVSKMDHKRENVLMEGENSVSERCVRDVSSLESDQPLCTNAVVVYRSFCRHGNHIRLVNRCIRRSVVGMNADGPPG